MGARTPLAAGALAGDLAGAPTGCWHRTSHTRDLDEHARAQPGWRLHYEQLSAGPFQGLLQQVQLPGARLVQERCSVALRQFGALDANCVGFALPLPDATSPTAGAPCCEAAIFNGQRVAPDDIMLGRGDALDLCTPGGFGFIAVLVDAALLQPLWQQLYQKPPSAWMSAQLVVPARPAAAAALRALHLRTMASAAAWLARHEPSGQAATLDGLANHPADDTALRQWRDALLIEWFEALPEAVDASALPSAQARKRLVDAACTLMLSQPDEPLSMLAVCRHVGASRRKLNYCFQDVLGTSPVTYLRAVRLGGVRRELRAGAGPIADVAARWGFWHAGQFSQDYRRHFGEPPSHTRRAAA